MAYFQMGILAVVGLIIFGMFLGYLIDLNKDATYQNRRQKRMRPPLEVVRRRRVQSGHTSQPAGRKTLPQKGSGRVDQPERGPRGPKKRK